MNGRGWTILSLCDFTGNWSRPYQEAGYEVIRVDLRHGQDVRLLPRLDGRVHGILAAPPCTAFSKAGAWKWEEWGDAAVLEGLSIVDACLRAVAIHRPEWWALENPAGRLRRWLGPPAWSFQPCDFGDPWTKRTYLWGHFTPPMPIYCPSAISVKPIRGDVTTRMSSSAKVARSATPEGFSRAFFEANP
jgi:hypothetical protein